MHKTQNLSISQPDSTTRHQEGEKKTHCCVLFNILNCYCSNHGDSVLCYAYAYIAQKTTKKP